jgi:hypothetical protein
MIKGGYQIWMKLVRGEQHAYRLLGSTRFLTAKLDLGVRLESFDLLANQVRATLRRYVDYCDAGVVLHDECFQGIYALATSSPKLNVRLEARVIMYDVAILIEKTSCCVFGIAMPSQKLIGRFIERKYCMR